MREAERANSEPATSRSAHGSAAAPRPTADEVAARKAIVRAAKRDDLGPANSGIAHRSDRVRVSALKALSKAGALSTDDLVRLGEDPSGRVRRAVAQVGAVDHRVDLARLLDDADFAVVETACWAAGERSEQGRPLAPLLAQIVTDHEDALCREAAVAALGAIGDPASVPAILAATEDRATVRRRAVLALAPFEGAEVDAALRRALEDRDWQVRQAAEDLLA